MLASHPRRYAAATFGLLTVCLVVLADWLFWHHPLGWTASAFTALLVLLLILRRPAVLGRRVGGAILIAVAGLVIALLIEPTPLALCMTVAGLLLLIVAAHMPAVTRTSAWVSHVVTLLILGLCQPLTDLRMIRRWRGRHPTGRRGVLASLAVWLIPLLLGSAFIALFALANPVISRGIEHVGTYLQRMAEQIPYVLDAMRIAFWVAAAASVWMLLRARPVTRMKPAAQRPPALPSQGDAGIALRCLLVFNAIFAVQNLLDARYLIAGSALPDGMTYAQYAQRGAYPLVAAALMAALFVVVSFRPGGAAECSRLARGLVYLWLGQTVVLTVAAAWRLELYVSIFSLSRLRLAAGIWMGLVALGLLWIGLRIVLHRSNTWLVNVNMLSATAVLYACCFFNIDGFIAAYNVRHAREMGGAGVAIDLPYLRRLGPEALPALRRLAQSASGDDTRSAAQVAVRQLERELEADLRDWRGWTVRRSTLPAALPPRLAEAVSPAADPSDHASPAGGRVASR